MTPRRFTRSKRSAALARHEQGERSDIVRELCARAAPAPTQPKVVGFQRERRRGAPSATELRRHLRQAAQALFNQAHVDQLASVEKALLLGIEPSVRRQEPTAHRWLPAGAAAALIAFGAGYAVVDGINALSRRSGTV